MSFATAGLATLKPVMVQELSPYCLPHQGDRAADSCESPRCEHPAQAELSPENRVAHRATVSGA